jgi:hypothetical protein
MQKLIMIAILIGSLTGAAAVSPFPECTTYPTCPVGAVEIAPVPTCSPVTCPN